MNTCDLVEFKSENQEKIRASGADYPDFFTIFSRLNLKIMKITRTLMILMVMIMSSISLSAQDYTYKVISRERYRFEGEWPQGYGVLYSYDQGLVMGPFHKGKPHGKCVCYKPNGEVYWGDFKRGKETGKGRIYRDNGVVVAGDYKNGRYHGRDTVFRSDGNFFVGNFTRGKLKETVHPYSSKLGGVIPADAPAKPAYPPTIFNRRQETFLNELENAWEERNLMIVRKAGLVMPKFQGGDIDDFALWVNSQVGYPVSDRAGRESRTVIVEFIVLKDGTVSDVHAIFGSDPVLNEEAVKAVSKSPKWTPGEQNGEKKNVRLSVPVVFAL